MKIFQVVDNVCYWDASSTCPNLERTKELFPPDCLFVEAPDYVFEGWGYDGFKQGDSRFICPVPPEGWLYDPKTGTMHLEGSDPPLKNDPMMYIEEMRDALNIIASGVL